MSRFGGIPVDVPRRSRFGGVPLDGEVEPKPIAPTTVVVAPPAVVARPQQIVTAPAAAQPSAFDAMASRAKTMTGMFEEDLAKPLAQLEAEREARPESIAERDAETYAANVAKGAQFGYENAGAVEKSWPYRTSKRIADSLSSSLSGTILTAAKEMHVPGAEDVRADLGGITNANAAFQDVADEKGLPGMGLASKATAGVVEALIGAELPGGFLTYATVTSMQRHLTQADTEKRTGFAKWGLAAGHTAIDAASIYAGGKLGAPLEKLVGVGGAEATVAEKAAAALTEKYSLSKAAQLATKITIAPAMQAAVGAATTVAHKLAGGDRQYTKQDLTAMLLAQLPVDLATGGVAGVGQYLGEVASVLSKRQKHLPATIRQMEREQTQPIANGKPAASDKVAPLGATQAAIPAVDAPPVKPSPTVDPIRYDYDTDGWVTPNGRFNSRTEAEQSLKPKVAAPDPVADLLKQHLDTNPELKAALRPAAAPPNPVRPADAAPLGIIAPGTSRAWDTIDAIKSLPQRIGDFITTKPIPNLSRAGVENEAFEHASARMAVPHVTNDLLAKVFPDTYHDKAAMGKTVEILNADNVLGLHDYFVDKHRNAEQAGDDIAAAKWAQKADAIGTADEIDALDQLVKGATPEIKANIDRWGQIVNPELDALYHEQKGLDPGAEPVERGRHYGARINLLDVDREAAFNNMASEGQPLPAPGGNLRNPHVKRDPYARHASGTGEYSTDAEAVLNSVLHGRLNEVSKLRLYKSLVDKGAATWEPQTGNQFKPLDVRVPGDSINGAFPTKTLHIKREVYGELRRVLDTDMPTSAHPILQKMNSLQLTLSLVDAAAHLKNQHTQLVSSLKGLPAGEEILRKLPGIATADAAQRMITTAAEVHSDTPAMRKELAFMARNGLLRAPHPEGGPLAKWMQPFGKALHTSDTAVRVISNRFFDQLVKSGAAVDTMENRRQFVNRIGVYNSKLMSPAARWMRDKGLSPFVTAGRTFNNLAKRTVMGDIGFTPTSRSQALRARAIQLSFLGAATAIPAVVNSVLNHGNPFGPHGTPIGAVGWEDSDGKLQIFDIFQQLGIRRGLRAIGANAVLRAVNEKRSVHEVLDEAVHDIASTALHPWMGPAVSAGVTTLTGQQLDLRQGPQPNVARTMDADHSQYLENLRVALKEKNPLVYAAVQPMLENATGGPDADNRVENLKRGAFKVPLSALGIQTDLLGGTPRDNPSVRAAKDLMGERGSFAPTVESAGRREITHALSEGDTGPLATAIQAGILSDADANRIAKRSSKTELTNLLTTASAIDTLTVWDKSDAKRRSEIQPLLFKKLENAFKTQSEVEQQQLIEKMRTVGFGG